MDSMLWVVLISCDFLYFPSFFNKHIQIFFYNEDILEGERLESEKKAGRRKIFLFWNSGMHQVIKLVLLSQLWAT